MSILTQGNSGMSQKALQDYYSRLRGGDDKKPSKVRVVREEDGTYSTYTEKGWWKKKRFTTGSKTYWEAKEKHKERVRQVVRMKWQPKRKAPHMRGTNSFLLGTSRDRR